MAQAKAKAKTPPVPAPVQPTDPAPTEGGGATPDDRAGRPTPPPRARRPLPQRPTRRRPAGRPRAPSRLRPRRSASVARSGDARASTRRTAPRANPAAAPKPRPWAGTQIFATSSMTTATFDKGQTQYNNPTVDALDLAARRATRSTTRGSSAVCSSSATSSRTPTTRSRRTSRASATRRSRSTTARSRRSPAASSRRVALRRRSPDLTRVARDDEHLHARACAPSSRRRSSTSSAARSISSRPAPTRTRSTADTTAEIRDTAPYAFQCIGGDTCQDQLSGTFNVSDRDPLRRHRLRRRGASGARRSSTAARAVGLPRARTSRTRSTARPSARRTGFGPTHLRQSLVLQRLARLRGELLAHRRGRLLARARGAQRRPAGTYGNPFCDRYQDQRVFVGLELQHRQHHEAARRRRHGGRHRACAEQDGSDRPVLIGVAARRLPHRSTAGRTRLTAGRRKVTGGFSLSSRRPTGTGLSNACICIQGRPMGRRSMRDVSCVHVAALPRAPRSPRAASCSTSAVTHGRPAVDGGFADGLRGRSRRRRRGERRRQSRCVRASRRHARPSCSPRSAAEAWLASSSRATRSTQRWSARTSEVFRIDLASPQVPLDLDPHRRRAGAVPPSTATSRSTRAASCSGARPNGIRRREADCARRRVDDAGLTTMSELGAPVAGVRIVSGRLALHGGRSERRRRGQTPATSRAARCPVAPTSSRSAYTPSPIDVIAIGTQSLLVGIRRRR